MSENISYRLSYLQTLLNPVGGVFQLALSLLTGVGAGVAMREAAINGVLGWLLPVVLCTVALFLLLYRSPRRRASRTIEFRADGVAFDLTDCVLGGGSGTAQSGAAVPYRYLTVHRGLGGVTVLKALSGHFVLIPESAIARERLMRLIDQVKAEQVAGPDRNGLA